MQSTITQPLIYSIELRSANIYNSGYIRIFKDGSIDGILTCDYFFILPATIKGSNEMFTLFNLCSIDLENNKPINSLFRFEHDNPFSGDFLYSENFAYSIFSSSIYISLKILKQITYEKFFNSICNSIDAIQKQLSP